MIPAYLLKVILISGLLFCYYFTFLRNKRFHQYNRFYLLAMAVLPVFLPLVKIPISSTLGLDNDSAAVSLLRVSNGAWQEPAAIGQGQDSSTFLPGINLVLYSCYLAGAGFLLISLVRSLRYIYRISRVYPFEQINKTRLFHTDEPNSPFSFFRNIFWNSRMDLQSEAGRQIFRHEWFHVRQKHSFDILIMEMLGILFWFNPFLLLFKKELKTTHEFLADQYAVSDQNPGEYLELLIEESLHQKVVAIVNPFFHNQIKRRILMLTQLNHPANSYLSRVMVLPLLFILFCAFSSKINIQNHLPAPPKTITVVIDAGHGGIDPGAQSQNGVSEKDIALSIAKKIQQFAGGYHINVVMTRDKDELPGGGTDVEEALRYRTNLVVQSKADLFLSIHVMADPSDRNANGFDMYVPGDGSSVHQMSVQFGSILSSRIGRDYKTAPDLKQRETPGIWVLRAATVPSVLVECGYISNEKDLAFISETRNQEKIARDMLESIIQFSESKTAHVSGDGPLATDTLKPGLDGTLVLKQINAIHIIKQ